MVELTKEYISDLIERQGMTKSEFAAKMGYTQRQYLDALLNNKKKDINTVVKMAEVLGIPLLEFIGAEEDTVKDRFFGCLFINGKGHVFYSKNDIEDFLAKLP